jgi:NADH-quinone oxidoreductase subunit A
MTLFAEPGGALGFFGTDFVKPFTITVLLRHPKEFCKPMSTEFTPIFLFLLVAIGIALSMMIASAVLGPHKYTKVKQMPYESGMNPFGDARQRFDVRYYLIAIVFLLFDVELLFLYPWAVAQWSGSVPAATPEAAGSTVGLAGIPLEFRSLVFWEIQLFIVILAAALAYAWKKGVFEWR